MKPRIHIIGGPGSGKSYVAGNLARYFDVPVYDLGDLFWDHTISSYGICADPEKRDQQLATIASRDGWVIEGVYYQWLAPSFKAADIIIALTPPIWIRHWRVIKRFVLRSMGRIPSKHESLADLWRLLRWNHAYDANNLVQARQSMAGQGRELVICRTVDDMMAAVTIKISAAPRPAV